MMVVMNYFRFLASKIWKAVAGSAVVVVPVLRQAMVVSHGWKEVGQLWPLFGHRKVGKSDADINSDFPSSFLKNSDVDILRKIFCSKDEPF